MRSPLLITVLAFPWWAMGQAPVPAQPPVPPVPPSRMVIPSGSYLGVGIQELTAERAKLKWGANGGVVIMRSEVTARMAMPMASSAGRVKPSRENRRGKRVSSFFLIASMIPGSTYN